jgi:hypothetical protein
MGVGRSGHYWEWNLAEMGEIYYLIGKNNKMAEANQKKGGGRMPPSLAPN